MTMQTIIQNKLSSMLDELLEKALEEKPKKINKTLFIYDYFKVYQEEEYREITILMKKENTESMGQNITYIYNLTDKQKEMINKILDKWGQDEKNKTL